MRKFIVGMVGIFLFTSCNLSSTHSKEIAERNTVAVSSYQVEQAVKKRKRDKVEELDWFEYQLTKRIIEVNKKLDRNTARRIARALMSASEEYNVPLPILISVCWQESHFNPKVYSKSGCIGLMQVNYSVWKKELNLKSKKELWDIETNIKAGAYILSTYYRKERNWKDALVRYYGISDFAEKVYKKQVLTKVSYIKSKLPF